MDRSDCIRLIEACKTVAAATEIHARIAAVVPPKDFFIHNKLIEMFGRCGDAARARQVFDGLAAKDPHSWVFMLSAYARNGQLRDAEDVFSAIPSKNPESRNAMLAAYAQNGNLSEELGVVEFDPHCVLSWQSIRTCSLDLQPDAGVEVAIAQTGDLIESKGLFESMLERNLVSHNAMLLVHVLKNELKAAEFVYENMPEHDMASWTSIMSVYSQHGHLECAKCIFDSMSERNIFCWNTMLSAYAQTDRAEEAEDVLSEMPQHDLVSWNTMLAAWVAAGQLDRAVDLFDRMPSRDIVSWNSMLCLDIVVYGVGGELTVVQRRFERMPEQNVVSLSTMMTAYAQSGHLHRSFDLFQLMTLTAVRPDAVCFIPLLISCSGMGTMSSGRRCFVSMREDFGIEPIKQHFCCMIDLLGREGAIEEAWELIRSMPFAPNALQWRCLLSACRSYKRDLHGTAAAIRVVGLEPSAASSYVLLANLQRSKVSC